MLFRELKRDGGKVAPCPEYCGSYALAGAGAQTSSIWRPSDWQVIEAILAGREPPAGA